MESLRLKRIEKLIRELICRMILEDQIKDPRIDKLINIYEVDVSKDLKYAKVYTTFYGEHAIHDVIVTALNHAAGFIQKQIGRELRIKHTPKLTFFVDNSIERGFRITQKLKELAATEKTITEIPGQKETEGTGG